MGQTRDGWVLVVLRLECYFAIAALTVVWALTSTLGPLSSQNAQPATQNTGQSGQVGALQASINDVRSLWIGDPPVWQPHGVPAATKVEYYPVTGTTQSDLMHAIENADICAHHGPCAVDPAVPSGGFALALEGDGEILPNSQYCYSPRTSSFHWTGHTILLPQWSPQRGSVVITTVQRWADLEQVLFIHEAGHVQVANAWLAQMNQQSARQPTCAAAAKFWANPHLFDSLDAAQNAYHAKLRADCKPEVGCIPYDGWDGWYS